MAKLFLDTNWFFDITVRDKEKAKILIGHQIYISPISYHILYYTEKIKVPNKNLNGTLTDLEIVSLNREILASSLKGPTKDLEDNIQLHSAAKDNCDHFLTNDKNLLKMKYFGKTEIVSNL